MTAISWTRFLDRARSALAKAGIDQPDEEAKWLVKLIGERSGVDMITGGDETIPMACLQRLEGALARRAAHEPLQHIVGETEFFGTILRTDARALIPRPDSECVVELALSYLPINKPGLIADLGAGTGALLIALLKQRPKVHGIAVEQSKSAVDLMHENLSATGLSERARSFDRSWTDWSGWADCDLIISNPPYIQSDVIATLEPEVRDHDPIEALDGGPDGLKAYREIILLAAERMRPNAHLVLEIGYDQKPAVSGLLETAGFVDLVHRKDLGGHDRAIAARHT